MRAIFGKAKYNRKTDMHTASSPLYKELNVLKLQDLYYYNLCISVFDIFHSPDYPEQIKTKFITQPGDFNYNLKSHSYNLSYNVPRLNTCYKKPSIAGTIIWNKLPNSIKLCNKKSVFKNNLKKFFIDKY